MAEPPTSGPRHLHQDGGERAEMRPVWVDRLDEGADRPFLHGLTETVTLSPS